MDDIIKSKLVVMLDENDKKLLKNNLMTNGYYTIKYIKEIIRTECVGDYTTIDVDNIISIDLNISIPIFILEDDVLYLDELIEKYKLKQFKISPEQIFNRQSIKILDKSYFIYDPEIEKINTNIETYKTNIYIGKDNFKSFLTSYNLLNSINFIKSIKNNNLIDRS